MKEQKLKQEKELIPIQIKNAFLSQLKKKSGLKNGYQTSFGIVDYRIILFNEEKNQLLVKVFEAESNWRFGFWFYCLNTGKYSKFNKEIHQTIPHNNGIVWQDFEIEAIN